MASPLAAPDTVVAPGPNPGAAAALARTLESLLEERGRGRESPAPTDSGVQATTPEMAGGRSLPLPQTIDRKIVALCRERGPLRAVLARLAHHLATARAWERIGFARLSDYAVECLGVSGRFVRSLAEVGVRLEGSPALEEALVSGSLGWTKVRLLARLPPEEDDAAWIGYAREVTAEELSRAVRAVDRGSLEAGAVDPETEKSRAFEVRCAPEVQARWWAARGAAARVAGRMLHHSDAAELIAAEVLSALPVDPVAEEDAPGDAGISWEEASERVGNAEGAEVSGTAPRPPWRAPARTTQPAALAGSSLAGATPPGPASPGRPASLGPASRGPARSRYPSALEPFLEGVVDADVFELDERLQRALAREQGLDARIGSLLTVAWERWVHRSLGYATREGYARERLGMDPTRARSLVRLERAAEQNPLFGRAYREGSLSRVKAGALAPLVDLDPLGSFVGDWVSWADRVTVRRLREDVDQAVALAEVDPLVFRQSGGLPAEARGDRVIGANPIGPETDAEAGGSDRAIGANPMERRRRPREDGRVRFIGSPSVVQLFQAVLCTVRRRLEQEEGRLPTAGEALGVMLDHVLSQWGGLDDKIAASHRVFARDGWRCAVPGCTSMQNLHDHHIRFRSAGGSDALENRVTLCAFHHLRGVHAGLVRCEGRAPDRLRWEMGIRPGTTPRLAYHSGDLRVRR